MEVNQFGNIANRSEGEQVDESEVLSDFIPETEQKTEEPKIEEQLKDSIRELIAENELIRKRNLELEVGYSDLLTMIKGRKSEEPLQS